MNCRYCTAQNDADDHRCKRCGRKLHTDARPFPVQNSALAPALDRESLPEMERPQPLGPRIVPPQPVVGEPRREPAYQASLFGPQEITKSHEAPARTAKSASAAPKPKRPLATQRSLEFPDPEKTHQQTVQSSIYCNAIVAPAPLRVAAVLFDFLYPAIGTGLFWGALKLTGQDAALASFPLWMYGAVLVLLTALYRTLYTLGNVDTPGMRWAGLKLLDFDGRRPSREQRLKRLSSGAISVIAAGLGVIWALVDEDRLTWHDHMSGTFATIADQSLFATHR